MNVHLSDTALLPVVTRRPWILIAAYDVSTGESSEGYVAFNVLRHLCKTYRIVLVTRRNNKERLDSDSLFIRECSGLHMVGYDLPKWASWWKRGAWLYQAYAYLWQMTWPQVLLSHTRLRQNLRVIHILNFHNDSIPSLAWQLRLPLVWGPINHNEIVESWRREFWPTIDRVRHVVTFSLRRMLWLFDPFLRLHIRHSQAILSAGQWVNRRLALPQTSRVIQRSQLGVNEADFPINIASSQNRACPGRELIYAGRLDWIKGVDLAIEALSLLPREFRLRIAGKGPAESRLRALVAHLNVEKRVTFQPPVSRKELSRIFSQADLFLFTSAEVAGLAWVEALACGLPVVAFNGVREVADAALHLPGIHLVKVEKTRRSQIESLAAAISAAAEEPRNAATLSEAVLEKYRWEKLATTIREAYCAAMGTHL